MLTGSLGQVPAFSIPVSPDAKHGTGDHPEPPNSMWDCCWGVKAARGVRGAMGMEAAGGKGSTPPALPCPQGSPPGPVPPFALRSALVTRSRSPASLDQEEQKPQVVCGG